MDGRVRRGAINRQAIVDAALELVVEQGSLPTAGAIAERAGLAKRSLFHHFPDMESLLTEAAATQAARHWDILLPPEAGLDIGQRVSLAVAQRAHLFEAISDVRRVVARYEAGSEILSERMKESRSGLRRHVRRMLNPEYSLLARPVQEGVQAMMSWEAWEVLRLHQGLSAETAQVAVRTMIEPVFERVAAKET